MDRLRVDANGLTFECLRAGDGDRLALCLHGFPDDAGSMAPLQDRLADAGFTAVAPYLRGYAPTEPAPDGDYSARALGADAIELAGALADELALDPDAGGPVLVGHDWGAVAGYAAARADPAAFDRMVTMAVPPRFRALMWRHPPQVLRSWYVWFFQVPGVAERALRRRDFALVEFLWSTWSPAWDYPPERIESVKDTFRRGDTVENALAYYRATVGDAVGDLPSEGLPDPAAGPDLAVPTLVVAGAEDGCIGHRLFDRAGEAFADDVACRVVKIRDAGHFMHQERPDVVGEEVVEFVG